MPVRFTWHGEKVKRAERAGRNKGLRMAAQHLLAEATALVPLDEGPLQNNGTVSVDESKGKAAVSYDLVYAARQHEELTWRHKPGRQAKYLEQPFHTEAETMRAIIAAQIRRSLRS
jgi:di/tripeptidase